jgi:uncharacterized protein YlbG (UPF0298 family)
MRIKIKRKFEDFKFQVENGPYGLNKITYLNFLNIRKPIKIGKEYGDFEYSERTYSILYLTKKDVEKVMRFFRISNVRPSDIEEDSNTYKRFKSSLKINFNAYKERRDFKLNK